jgi:hypothetical protein
MTGLDLMNLVLAGLGVLMIVMSFFAKPSRGYRKPLDSLGPSSFAEREWSRHEASYNRNPRLALIKGGLAFIGAALLFSCLSTH